MTKNFLIVEDHPLFADALQAAIQVSFADVEIELACSITEARNAYKHRSFDLVLLDLSLPDNHGFSGIIELRRKRPRIPIIIVSAFDDHKVIHCAMTCGASGFISKSEGKSIIVSSIESVLLGGVALPISFLQDAVLEDEPGISIDRFNSLTLQELRVLYMLCQGMLNKQISHEFQVSESTIKAHVSAILSKLQVSSRTQAVIEASKFYLSPVPEFYSRKNPIRGHSKMTANTNLQKSELARGGIN